MRVNKTRARKRWSKWDRARVKYARERWKMTGGDGNFWPECWNSYIGYRPLSAYNLASAKVIFALERKRLSGVVLRYRRVAHWGNIEINVKPWRVRETRHCWLQHLTTDRRQIPRLFFVKRFYDLPEFKSAEKPWAHCTGYISRQIQNCGKLVNIMDGVKIINSTYWIIGYVKWTNVFEIWNYVNLQQFQM